MLVYSHTITPRLQYVLHFLSRYYGQAIPVTADEAFYHAAPENCKIWYSSHPVSGNEIHIEPCMLLFEKDAKPIVIECFDYNGNKAFFKTGGGFPFDLFAAVFYLLSRYEEYLPHGKDAYGRYAHENAMAYQHNFLKTPLINSWLEDFRTILAQKDASFSIHYPLFTFQPTYDIDVAWSYKAKGFKRTAGALFKGIASGRWHAAKERMQVLQGKSTDPYDAYNWLDNLHRQYSLRPLYFFLVAEQRGILDKNPSPYNKLFQKLIRDTATQSNIGLHPSWQSGDDAQAFQNEKKFLETTAGQPITTSRQHYIRLTLPQTYRQLISTGITDDYSMGYGTTNGFRASVATPFYWYDLEREQETGLLLYPFCFMDANAYYEQRQTPEETWEELLHYYSVVKSVHGNLCTIWHNHFLGTDKTFKGWRELYERFVALASS